MEDMGNYGYTLFRTIPSLSMDFISLQFLISGYGIFHYLVMVECKLWQRGQ